MGRRGVGMVVFFVVLVVLNGVLVCFYVWVR